MQKRAKRPVGVPDVDPQAVTFVGVIGAGLMARQLGVLVAERMGVPVHLVDVDEAAVQRARDALTADLEGRVAKKRLRPDAASKLQQLITISTDRAPLADADLVIEAVYEDLDLKRQVFADLERVVRPTACSPPTPARYRSQRWLPACSIRSGWSGCTSSTRLR